MPVPDIVSERLPSLPARGGRSPEICPGRLAVRALPIRPESEFGVRATPHAGMHGVLVIPENTGELIGHVGPAVSTDWHMYTHHTG